MGPVGAPFFVSEVVSQMPEPYVGFVDAGYLRVEGARKLGKRATAVRPNASTVADWFLSRPSNELEGQTFLRAYWYDGAFDPWHPEYGGQRRFFDAIAHTPGVQLRLGHIAERQSRLGNPIRYALRNTAAGLGIESDKLIAEFDKNWTFYPDRQQKGVDTLITLDMVRLAGRSAFETAIVIAGDRDLAEVVRTVQNYGVRVLIATPNRASVANEVLQLADDIIDITEEDVHKMLPDRPERIT